MALYYFPWYLFSAATTTTKENPKPAPLVLSLWPLRASICLAALAVVLRPTNVLIWATVVALVLFRVTLRGRSPLTFSAVLVLIREGALCGALVLGVSFLSDRMYFGFWTFPPYKWLNFNISQSLAVFYGRNPWHYYLLQGLPLLCTTSLPFALWGLYRPAAKTDTQFNVLKTLSCTVFTTVAALSLISHKEVRFIYPLLPILNVLAAPVAASFFTTTQLPPATSGSSTKVRRPRPRLRKKPYLLAALGVNFVLAGYLSFFHQAAPLNVLTYLRREYERVHPDAVRAAHMQGAKAAIELADREHRDALFALFLMPCHSTPWRSHLVYPSLHARALTCEPPLHTLPNTEERLNYRDEADRFYDDPDRFVNLMFFEAGEDIPRYIVGFEGLEPWLNEYLAKPDGQALGMSLRRVWTGFNGLFNEDWRRAGKMVVWDTGVYDNAPPKKT